jgi:hypothetical protein
MACERARVGMRRAQIPPLGLPHAWLRACSNRNEPAALVYRRWGSRRCVSGWRRWRRRERYAHTRGPVYVLELAAERLLAMASVDSSRTVSLHVVPFVALAVASATPQRFSVFSEKILLLCMRVIARVGASKTPRALQHLYTGERVHSAASRQSDSGFRLIANRRT